MMWRNAFSSTFRLVAELSGTVCVEHQVCHRSLNPPYRRLFPSSHSLLWSTSPSRALYTGANPLGFPFREVRDGAATNAEMESAMSMMKVEPRSSVNKVQENNEILHSRHGEGELTKRQIGDNLSRRDKCNFLLDRFSELKDSKEAVYGALDAWVAWERYFPLAALRRALIMFEKDGQWHRIIQVIKWMLSKGQGNTMGTYEQLIRALEKDHRPEEAHSIWVKKFSYDMHSAPWRVCELMISIYCRNNMLERAVKLFRKLEAFGRKPPKKSIVRKVADAYEVQGLLDEKHKVLEKYSYLFKEPTRKVSSKSQQILLQTKKDDKILRLGGDVLPTDADASEGQSSG